MLFAHCAPILTLNWAARSADFINSNGNRYLIYLWIKFAFEKIACRWSWPTMSFYYIGIYLFRVWSLFLRAVCLSRGKIEDRENQGQAAGTTGEWDLWGTIGEPLQPHFISGHWCTELVFFISYYYLLCLKDLFLYKVYYQGEISWNCSRSAVEVITSWL